MSKRLLAALLIWLALAPASAGAALLFDSPEQSAADDPDYAYTYGPRWQRVLRAEQEQPTFSMRGEGMLPPDTEQWRNLVKKAAASPDTKKLRMVNGYFNHWRPQQDAAVWETPEYWASPAEFVARRGGDCEDYATAKYFALRFLGLPADRMRLVVIRQVDGAGTPAPRLHAVLAVRTNQTWFILDNNARPRNSIMPHTQYQGRFVPLFSMNENDAWKHLPDPLRAAPADAAATRPDRK